MSRAERFAAPAVVLAAGLLVALPILVNAALPFGSDLGYAAQAAHGFTASLREGIAYPRWLDDCNRGYGAPAFVFYPPLMFYAVALAAAITPDVVQALRLVLVLVAVGSGFSFYAAARSRLGATAAAAGAVVYALAPAHVLDLYDRFAFAQFAAFCWFPPLLAALLRLLEGPSRRAWFVLALSGAGLVLTHLVTAYMVGIALLPGVLILAARGAAWRRLLPVAGAAAWALLAAAVYLVPIFAQRHLVHMEWVVDAPYGDWRRNFVFRDEVAFGFMAAPIKPHVALAAASQGLLCLAAIGIGAARCAPRPSRLWAALVAVAVWTFYLQVPWSAPVWTVVPELGTVQFPWRFAVFQALAMAALVAVALQPSPAGESPHAPATGPLGRATAALRTRRGLALGLLALAALPALIASVRFFGNREYNFDAATARRPVYRGKVMFEYIPQGVAGWRDLEQASPEPVQRAALAAPGRLEVVSWTTHARRLQVESETANAVRLRTFHYPAWRARVDGRNVAPRPYGPLRVLEVPVPAGTHEVEVLFAATGDRRLGAGLSGIGLVTMAGLAAMAGRRRGPT